MSIFSFTNGAGEVFTVKGPDGFTSEQAQAIWKQQTDTGSLVGLPIGGAVSAATQAAGGLASAASQLGQQAASLAGSLTKDINLKSITAGIGATGLAAAGQVTSALAGASAAVNSLTTGASTAVGNLLGSIPTTTPGVIGALTGAAASAGSLANQTVTKLAGSIGSVAPNGINVADFVKQGPALGSISNMSLPDVTGVLAQTSKLVGQGASTISNALGVGKFGLDTTQLEKAGLVKPGTAASFLAQGANDPVSVLKSPTVWTGKEGVKSLDGLLNNTGLQDKVQQGLMATGLTELKALGIPVDNLNPQALSGLATNAAKSVPATVDWIKNVPGLPPGIKTSFDAAAVNGAFATNLVQKKIDAPVLQETAPVPAANTVDTATVDAASKRVVGNDKVPSVTASNASYEAAKTLLVNWINFLKGIDASFSALGNMLTDLETLPTISQAQWEIVNNELQVIRAAFNTRQPDLQQAAVDAINKTSAADGKSRLTAAFETMRPVLSVLIDMAKALKIRVADLANKIAT